MTTKKKIALLCILLIILMLSGSPFAFAKGGGGCFEQGTPILTPHGTVAIDTLRIGDRVLTLINGRIQETTVANHFEIMPEEYVELSLPGKIIRVTAKHLFATQPGEFRKAGSLQNGDTVLLWNGTQLNAVNIFAVKRVKAMQPAFNLLVADGGTYFAAGVLVHNKGCFLPDTPILRGDGSTVTIRQIQAGDQVMAFRDDGAVVKTDVRDIITHTADEYFVVTTEHITLNVTAEHPFFVGNGTFKTLAILKTGDQIFAFDGQGLTPQRIVSIERRAEAVTVYNLQTDEPHTFFAAGIAVHNKGGGCFPVGTLITTPTGSRAIETLAPGETITAVQPDGSQTLTTIQAVFSNRSPLVIVQTDSGTLRTTAEHPLAMSDGSFRLAGAIEADLQVLTAHDNDVTPAVVRQIEMSPEPVTVFNLTVGSPHTFIADGFVVHNKGCFLPETPILRADGSTSPISQIQAGDQIAAFDENGAIVNTTVNNILVQQVDEYLIVTTDRAVLNVTADHPFFIGGGAFKTLGTLAIGDRVFAFDGQGLSAQSILNIRHVQQRVTVYNLQTDAPNTFFAAGIAVHNKGGGSFSRSSSSGSRSVYHHYGSYGSSGSDIFFKIILITIVIIVIIVIANKWAQQQTAANSGGGEELDMCFSPRQVSSKAIRTKQLLQRIAQKNPTFAPEKLKQTAKTTFLTLQKCWQARDYDPMVELMMPALHRQHVKQLDSMIRNHEINIMDNLNVDAVDLVNVRYMRQAHQCEFTALITMTMTDYYIDDRTEKFIRGDKNPARSQEFWTFQLQDETWRLREIEQPRESSILQEENFVEDMNDLAAEQTSNGAEAQMGQADLGSPENTELQGTKMERLLYALSKLDPLWDRQHILDRARQIFTDVYVTRELLQVSDAVASELFPNVADKLRADVERDRKTGRTVEFRNFCVRKVEIMLVRNFKDNSKDEFFTRIYAHAQRISKQGERVISQDEFVTPFEQYWTFGRLDKQWKLKEILPPGRGRMAENKESVNEDFGVNI